MKTISKRKLTRNPSQLTRIRPGESIRVEDRQGALLVTRPKPSRLILAEMEAELDRQSKGLPQLDTLSLLQEGE
jgi:hypothetical protein